ncbi:Replication protein P, partial [Pseudomonas putida]|nr:Replication protein P [Pseudomonas putida]
SMEVERAEKVFARAYDITIRMLVAGEPLGDIATGIGHDSQKSAAQLADEYASQRQARLLEVQQIPSGAAACRAHLLAKLNIKRAGQPAGEGV